MHRATYFLVDFIYLFFIAWSGLQITVEMIPLIFLVIALTFAGLAPNDLAKNKNGFVTACVVSTGGIIACIADAYRLYGDVSYTFDGFSISLFFVTLFLLIAFMVKSFFIFKRRSQKDDSAQNIKWD